MRLIAVAIIAFSAILAPARAELVTSDPDLRRVLDAHVLAVQERNLAALEKTITEGEALDLILPNGKRMTTKTEYLALHREWFASTNWTWKLEPIAVVHSGGMAIVTARTHYEETENGKTTWSENWLSLTFRNESAGWRLVHDQNTRVATGP